MEKLTNREYEQFCDFLQHRTGIVLGSSKQYLVSSRLNRLLNSHHIQSLAELVSKVQLPGNQSLLQDVIDAMTTNETNWFRDVYPFEILVKKVLPEVSRGNRARIWCAACSSGQEPYSIKMLLAENQAKIGGYQGAVDIVATDLSDAILQQAQAGEFDQLALVRGLSEERKKRFFEKTEKEGILRVNARLKQGIQFRKLNLKDSFQGIGQFDVVFCRNVLIYFSSELKKDILSRIAKTLKPGGYLFLGASESAVGFSRDFEMVRCNPGIIYRLKS
ncbi:MAG TPA: protein-glutamate O-methyltransferase CheR [Aeromonadales bacterium]|nr:protein-glutamate O-methyltransferase CheR [Aeromonadales bacterium]